MDNDQNINLKGLDGTVSTWVMMFLVDRKCQNLSRHTISYYRNDLRNFSNFCAGLGVEKMADVSADTIRQFLLALAERGHSPGGVHGHYRAVRALCNFWAAEADLPPAGNPIRRVKAPKVPEIILPPVEIEDVKAMLAQCEADIIGKRDTAVILTLLDTGARGSEIAAIRVGDVNLVTGEIKITEGKGGRYRLVFAGPSTRKALRQYLNKRGEIGPESPLFAARDGRDDKPMTYWGISQLVERRALDAGINPPGLHAFRRAFCINSLRAGMPMATLRKITGHADYQVLMRYLKITDEDTREAHAKYGPVEHKLKNQ